MRRPKGMTAEGLARKVQGRAVFSKLLFLAEMEGLLAAVARPRSPRPPNLSLLRRLASPCVASPALRCGVPWLVL